ncbi:FHA domain-containing protein [Saccharopolyspora spinosa]|uniref:PSer/pThr/pTyr-binding forkhead associated (FHA) protein n=1 Tax=Saccharopolyspora spinosa TaxID=60894 RepID=A0A2N3Y243_SACSN|nr:FHA domain-containing protein [Saccharopolyspora spinosa]PKW16989.1 pSer/pThr/pTyr-binding forkhead associated (FHA) protein [Saccharopolyspora spinosa]
MNQRRFGTAVPPTEAFRDVPPAAIPAEAGVDTPAPRAAAAPTGSSAELVIARGPQAGTAIPVTGTPLTVGRSRDCDITLDAPTVSHFHAQICQDGEQCTITDSGSLNGTYVNHAPVDRAELADGDEVWIGTFRFTFRTK